MTPERYKLLGELFHRALEHAPEKRLAFVRQACGADAELREEVEKLLANHVESGEFLSHPAMDVAATLIARNAATPLEGRKIGHYQVHSLLGAGGMGEVYLAEDTSLRRKVALKVLPAMLALDQYRLHRFQQEALAASSLNHPNILTIYEFGTEGETHYLVTEFIEGETLRDRLRRGALSLSEALDFTQQIATALQAAHEAGIIHRDIKPENIMLRRDGLVKVLDFGLAKLTWKQNPASASTDAGTVVGTIAYMSPEQARGQKVDARSDLWSLGVVLYEMLTGQRPFHGESVPDVFVAILERQPAPVTRLLPDPLAPLNQLLSRLLAKNREERYQSSAQLAAELKRFHHRLELDAERAPGDALEAVPLFTQQTVPTAKSNAVSPARDKQDNSSEPALSESLPGSTEAFWQRQNYKVRYSIFALIFLALISSATFLSFLMLGGNQKTESIAVLPFENRSGNPELTYVSEGLSERLIDQLSEFPQLKVISRNSSSRFRGANPDLRNVASQLGVRLILMGSVAKAGEDLVIRFDLVDAANDQQIAGGQYQRKASNILYIQNEIVQAASQKLRLRLSDSQSRRLVENDTENSDAYRYYLKGLVELNSPQDFQSGLEYGKALEHFEQAVSLDSDFAAAHAEIAWVYWTQANGNGNPRELMPKAKEATLRALAIDPDLAKAHVVMATVNEYEFNWAGAEREYLKAMELSPNLDFARANYAFFLSVMGRHAEALAELEQLSMRDPINQRMTLLWKVAALAQARRFDDALQAYREAQALERDTDVKPFALGYVYAGKRLYSEAASYYRKAVDLVGGEEKYSQPLVYLAATYARMPEKRNEARALLKRIETMSGYASPALLAAVYAALDDPDKAMELLERAYLERDLLLRFIKTGYEYDGLRTDRRFIALTKRIGLGS
jgi:serine/threonine protein kinase/Tfp pilus assembly protein PilF